ncbi:MAG: hypothetical protein APF77_23885 [Clostridia bacterium BRH_c25]|nr:MAG: hypothetical protein APF77_23885 [Clostridia bacterium BRH_c25]
MVKIAEELKRIVMYVDESEKEKTKDIKNNIFSLLASYPKALIADAYSYQINYLESYIPENAHLAYMTYTVAEEIIQLSFTENYGEYWPDDFGAEPIKSDPVSDNPEGMAAFSSRGPTLDGRIKPDVVAPGTNILSVRSCRATDDGWGLPADEELRKYYMYMGGTSMATPIAAGSVALIRQYLMNVRGQAGPSSALLKAVLIHGAVSMKGQYDAAHPDTNPVPDSVNQGWGRIDMKSALTPTPPVKVEFRDNPEDAVGSFEQVEYDFSVEDSSVPFKATLVWTDFPCKLPAVGLVNRLLLSVKLPEGDQLLSAQAGSNNNVHQVVINKPRAGKYTVIVEGIGIAEGISAEKIKDMDLKQDFALVISGGLKE